MQSIYRYPDGVWPNTLALAATVLLYPLGLGLMLANAWGWNILGLACMVLSLTWSAYFIHEFAHHAIFRRPETNARWGTFMSWLNGSCYARYEDMRRKHMRHHVERADVVTFDAKGYLLKAPAWLRNTVLALEWAYFPAVEYLMRGFVIAMPFRKDLKGHNTGGKLRMVAIIAVRFSALALLGWVSLKALILYCVAVLIFITLLRFADCFQHTYIAYPILDDTPLPKELVRDRVYEQANTYSDVVGVASGLGNNVLNMLWLNFGFHNAHHERPTVPWYRLPAYHRELYPADYAQVVTVGELLRSFHVNRLKRILADDYGAVAPVGVPGRANTFVGAVGVSFLTAV
ncbi:fatty acid desaturase [Rhodoferax sp. GW822-FHT02A01]|uniref:fatty acid desaturase family protein n=1 Tax=Rhodoferax sp. GW822-FHT02A01 TaxID=3141537 RepID=UPI00315D80F3